MELHIAVEGDDVQFAAELGGDWAWTKPEESTVQGCTCTRRGMGLFARGGARGRGGLHVAGGALLPILRHVGNPQRRRLVLGTWITSAQTSAMTRVWVDETMGVPQ